MGVSHELRVLGAVLVVLLSALAFFAIADEVAEGDLRRLDEGIVLALRAPGDPADPIGPEWLEEVGRDVSALGAFGTVLGLAAVVCGYLALDGRRGTALLIAVSAGGGALLCLALKAGYARPRPDLVAHEAYVVSHSFPSGHSMMSATVYLTLAVLVARVERRRRVKAWLLGVALALTLAVGASRVYLGVHYPSDVVAGWAAGAGWALSCGLVARWLGGRVAAEAAPEP